MSTITECLPAGPMTEAVTLLGRIKPSPVVVTAALQAATLFNTIKTVRLDTTGAMTAAIASQLHMQFIQAGVAHASASVHDILHALDLLRDAGHIAASIHAKLVDLRTSTGAMAVTLPGFHLTSLVQAGAAHMSAGVLPGGTFKDIVTIGMVLKTAILLNVKQLAVAGAMTGHGAIVPGSRFLDTIVAGVLTGHSLILDKLTTTDFFTDTGNMVAAAFGVLHAIQLAEDEGQLSVRLYDQQGTDAWSAPTDTFAMSRYHFDENLSTLTVGAGVMLMLGSDGGFLRDPTARAALGYVKTGLSDFDDEYFKQGDKAYLGYIGDGAQIDVGETRSGVEVTWPYLLPARASVTAPSAGRFDIGRGIESRYLRFTVRNAQSEDLGVRRFLSVRGLQIDYLKTKRRG